MPRPYRKERKSVATGRAKARGFKPPSPAPDSIERWIFEEQKPVKCRSVRRRKHFVVAKKKTADILRRNTIFIPLALDT